MVSMGGEELTLSEIWIDERENQELDHSEVFRVLILRFLIGSCFLGCLFLNGCLNFGGG